MKTPREKAETERWFFVAKWCKDRGISPMLSDNFNRAAMEWAKANCFQSTESNCNMKKIFKLLGDTVRNCIGFDYRRWLLLSKQNKICQKTHPTH